MFKGDLSLPPEEVFKFFLMVSCPIYIHRIYSVERLIEKEKSCCFQWYLQGLLQILQKVFGNT